MPSAEPSETSARTLLWVAIGVGLLARVGLAIGDDGLYWPDEYYQALEPAHRAVFGYGWQAWEFVAGARHWTLPGLVAGVFEVAQLLHLPLVATVKVLCALVHVGTIGAVAFLARELGASQRAAAVVALVFALMGYAVFVAPRTLGEGLGALPVTLGLALSLKPTVRRAVIAGALLSLAVGLRLQHGFFAIAALLLAWRSGQRRPALVLLGVLGVGAIVFGAIDRLTWGEWFHSARTYVGFNVLEGKASDFGVAPWWKYGAALVTAEGVTVIPLVLLTLAGLGRSKALPLTVLLFVVAHSLIPHKELRFVFAALPLLAAAAAPGLDLTRPPVHVAVLVLAAISLVSLPWLTFGRMGLSDPPRETPALDYGGPYNRLLARAGKLDDVCGVRIADFAHWRTAGYAIFHREAPLYRAERPGEGEGHFNYVIARRGVVTGATEVAADGDVVLSRLTTPCTPDPAYDWHLE
ncbi:MAG: hypothetical protein U0228_24815 [Myxococcaceae bacterium]